MTVCCCPVHYQSTSMAADFPSPVQLALAATENVPVTKPVR